YLSCSITLISSPPIKSIASGISTLKLPCSSASTSTVILPGNVIVTVELGSELPTICASSLDTLFILAASVAVLSITIVEVGFEIFLVLSVVVTCSSSPSSNLVPNVVSFFYLSCTSAVPVAFVVSGIVTVSFDPRSALPPIVVSSLVTSFAVGASGAVVSLSVVLSGSVSLPASSVDVTCISSPPSKLTSFGIAIV